MQVLNILKYFPESIFEPLETFLNDEKKQETIEEIRLRINKPIILKLNDEEKIFSNNIVTYGEILAAMQRICENSIYSYQNQICNGYITIRGGHRVGIVGSSVIEKKKVVNLNYISGLNFRISRQVIGCSDKLLKHVINKEEKNIYNTIIVSPPGSRKDYNVKGLNKADKYRNIKDGL